MAEFLDAEINEIGCTEVFDDAEGGGRRDEQGGKADGGCGGVDQRADTDTESGDEAGVATVADAAADDVEDGGAGDGEEDRGGADEDQERGVAGERGRWMSEAERRLGEWD